MKDFTDSAYRLGNKHGKIPGHPFDPPKDFITEQRLAYGRGFDDGVDFICPKAKPLNQE